MKKIVSSNLVMENVTGSISISLIAWHGIVAVGDVEHKKAPAFIGEFHDVIFSNILGIVAEDARPNSFEGEQRSCISITGLHGQPIRGIPFSDMRINYPGGGTKKEAVRRDIPDLKDPYPEYFMFGILSAYAYGLYMHHAENIKLDNVKFELADTDLRPALICDDVKGLELSGF